MFLDYFSVLYQKLFLKNKKSYFNILYHSTPN
jgi:hypothetical protein